MTRADKIARLPAAVRRQLNLRLQDGENDRLLLQWLNSLPEVKKVAALEFAARPVDDQDLTEWKKDGYRDWLSQQQALAASRLMAEEVAELDSGAAKPLSERLAAWLVVRYLAESQRLRKSTGDPELDWRRLREFTSDLSVLRRGDQNAQRLDLDRQWLTVEYDWLFQAKQDSLERWKRKLEMAMEAFNTYLGDDNPEAKAALQALFAVVRGPFDKFPGASHHQEEAAPTAPRAPNAPQTPPSDSIRLNPNESDR